VRSCASVRENDIFDVSAQENTCVERLEMTTPNLWSSGPISMIEAIASLGDACGEWSLGDEAGVDREEPPAAEDDDTRSAIRPATDIQLLPPGVAGRRLRLVGWPRSGGGAPEVPFVFGAPGASSWCWASSWLFSFLRLSL
jgi:hypothetical protein